MAICLNVFELYKSAQDAISVDKEIIEVNAETMKFLLETHHEQERTIKLLESLIVRMGKE